MTWTTLTLQVTTPLFNGGADPGTAPGRVPASDDGTGVRVPALRGAMRFWFRALAGAVIGPGGTAGGPGLRVLADLESAVFGRAALGNRDTGAASPLRMRIAGQPELSREPRPPFLGPASAYLLGQGLSGRDGRTRSMRLTRPYVPAGQTFPLKMRCDGDERAAVLALAALWLTCAYGGVGARVRRGFGGLRIVHAEGPLPGGVWDHDSIRTPGPGFYENARFLWPAGPLEDCMRPLASMAREHGATPSPDPWPEPPPFPVLSKRHTQAGLSGERFTGWEQILQDAGEQLRNLRASAEDSERGFGTRRKTPEWEKVIHGDEERFPVGALGLPVVYRDYVVNARGPQGEMRRASPLWLRPVGSGREWRLLSFAFLGSFLPSGAGVSVGVKGRNGRPKPVIVNDEDVRHLTAQWITTLNDGGRFEPGDRIYPPRY